MRSVWRPGSFCLLGSWAVGTLTLWWWGPALMPAFICWVAENMQEIAATTLGTGTAEEQATDSCFPTIDRAELAADWASRVPSTVEHSQCLLSLLLTGILNVHIPTQMRLKVSTHTHLADSASTAQFLEHVPEEGLKVCLQLPLIRLEAVVTMVLLQGKVAVQATQQQCAAHSRTRVRPRAPVTKAAGTRLEVEGAWLSRCIRSGSRWVVPTLLPRCRW